MDAERYVSDLLAGFDYGQVLVEPKKRKGFYTYWRDYKHYFIDVPINKFFKLSFFGKLALRHEVGHVIFHYLSAVDPVKLSAIVAKIRKRRIFAMIQRFWYWNKAVRFLKRCLGFSRKLGYKARDKYESTVFYRWENELYCDWFALAGHKQMIKG